MGSKESKTSKIYDEIQDRYKRLFANNIELSATTLVSAILEVAAVTNTNEKNLPSAIKGIYANWAALLVPYIERRDELIWIIRDSIIYKKIESGEMVLAYRKFFPDRLVPLLEEQVLNNALEVIKDSYVFEFTDGSTLKELHTYLEGRRACVRNNLKGHLQHEVSLTYGLWVQYQKQIVLELTKQLKTLIKPQLFGSDEELEMWLGEVSELGRTIDYELKELDAIGSGAAEEMKVHLEPLVEETKQKVEPFVKHLVNTGYWS